LLTALFGCGERPGAPASVEVTVSDSAGVARVTITGSVLDLPQWALSATPVVEIDGASPPFLGSVGEVELLSDGRLLVEDEQSHELYLFGANGEPLRRVGGRGEGPGEFLNLTELSLAAGDTAYAYDRRLYRITEFDPTGGLVSTVRVGREFAGEGTLVLDGWGFDSDHLLIHVMGPPDSSAAPRLPRRDQRDALLFPLDGSGLARSAPRRFAGGYSIEGERFDAPAPFANRPIVAVGADRVVRGSGLRYELFVETRDLDVERIIRWDGWRLPLSDSLLRAVRDTVDAGFEKLRAVRPDLVRSLMDAEFSEDLLPDTLPALGAALVDDRGRIWVARFRPSTDRWKQEDSWHVLAPDGHPLARVALPGRARLAAVRDDHVALIVRDELDVEHVRVFELAPSGP